MSGKNGDVRREDATQNIHQGLAAQMSVEKGRCVQGILNIRRRTGVGCALVMGKVETCAERIEYAV